MSELIDLIIKSYSASVPSFTFVGILVLLEALVYRVKLKQDYAWAFTISSFGVALGRLIPDAFLKTITIGFYFLAYSYRPWDLNISSASYWLALFFLYEFAYYWQHRAFHGVRLLWAEHTVHHSSEIMTLSGAIRQGWTNFFTGAWLIFAPLCFIGFHPSDILQMILINILYQFLIHTELIKKLGPLEWFLNTPSHHRVHHGLNEEYIDKNFGGIVIIYDRIFGTFKEEDPKIQVRYGLKPQVGSLNPLKIVFFEWHRLWQDLKSARSTRERFLYLFGSPGTSPSAKE